MLEFETITFNLANSPIRRAMLHGRKYIIAPMAMLTEGVHNGSNGPLLYKEEDIKRAVPAWNMKPIVVYHPVINAKGVTACDPDILERQQVGMVMNTVYKGKLRAEAWIEEALAARVDNRVLDALEGNKVMEVSTGLFTDNVAEAGKWGDKEYTHVATNHQPDHLALLPDQIGACSVADGAGLLQLNAEAAGFVGAEVMDVARRIVGNAMSHSNVHDALNKELRKKVPEKRKGVGEDSYRVGPWVMDVYDKFLVYEMEGKLYRLDYTIGKAGVEITGEPVEVIRTTEYRTAADGKFVGNNTAQNQNQTTENNTAMKKEDIVNGLIANTATQWGEDDRATLMALDEAVLNKMGMSKADEAKAKADEEEEDAKGKKSMAKNEAASAPAAPQTTEQYIAGAPPEIREVLQNGMAAHNREKGELITTITANAANPFTAEFLGTKGLEELRGLAALAAPVGNAEGGKVVHMFNGAATPTGPTRNATPTTEAPLEIPTLSFKGA